MRRRDFISLVGGSAVAWPLAARAQQANVRRIGVLITSSVNAQSRINTIRQHLQRLGWSDGRNIRIKYRQALGDRANIKGFTKELLNQQPDLVVAHGSVTVQEFLQETQSIPIVFVHVADPLGQRFVASWARPGGNVTGFSNFEDSMGGKWASLLKEIAPDITRIALIANPGTTPYAVFLRSVKTAVQRLGIELISALVHDTTELEAAISAQGREPGGAIVVLPDVFTSIHQELIVQLAARHRLPAIYSYRFFATVGGLIAYGVDPEEPFGRVSEYIDRILKGERPGDLPVQGPTRFQLVINLKTAKVLGLSVPMALQASADEVIE
jgi:putative ABC transport system substrate-binding protein